MISRLASRSRLLVARNATRVQRAAMHLGRATAEDTLEFLNRSEAPSASVKLRLGEDSFASITHRGIGSPYLWAKDIPRIDATKAAITGFKSNFIQTSFNPYVDAPLQTPEKQAYVESLVIQEAIEDEGIPREALVLSALVEDTLVHPASADPIQRLSREFIEKGLKTAVNELNIEALDHLVVRVPEELILSAEYQSKLVDALDLTAGILQDLSAKNKIQSFGFALPQVSSLHLERLVESTFLPLSTQCSSFSSLQAPCTLGSSFPPIFNELQQSRGFLVFAEKVFDCSLANGKPFILRTYAPNVGEDVALLLKSAFNLAISIERKYAEKILPEHPQLKLPAAEDVAWAHILANQHSQFDNLEEWIYIRETQISPCLEITVKQFEDYEELKEFGFAYSMALRELLKCFTASIEILDASRAENILTAVRKTGLVSQGESLEQVATRAALSAGADVVIFQEQLGKSGSFSHDPLYTPSELGEIGRIVNQAIRDE